MLQHQFKYALLQLVRAKQIIFWTLVFPIILATLFQLAFGNLNKSEFLEPIPVAIVMEDDTEVTSQIYTVLEGLAKEGDDQLLTITKETSQNALSLLESKSINGIFTIHDKLSLTLSSDIKGKELEKSILSNIVEQINLNVVMITDVAIKHPEKLSTLIDSLKVDCNFIKEDSHSNFDITAQYFYNLIAMSCLYTAFAGLVISLQNQANLTEIGARRNISPANKLCSIFVSFVANIVVQFISVLFVLSYLLFVLNVDFGSFLPETLLICFVGCLTGVSLGFFVGTFGNVSENTKIGIIISVCMSFCFLSGLMVGNMYIIVENYFPLLNRINPATLISNCFYSLQIHDSYTTFYQNIITLLILSAGFLFGGICIVRRKKYASL